MESHVHMALVRFGWTLPLTMASVIAVGLQRWLFVSHFFYYDSNVNGFARNNVECANLASVMEALMCLMMCAMLRMTPLLGGMPAEEERKKWPPARLRAFGSER
jgi:hypothetical protein